MSSFDKEIVEKYNIKTDNNKVIGAFKSETGSEQMQNLWDYEPRCTATQFMVMREQNT